MPFEPIKITGTTLPTISLDKYRRLRISRAAMRELKWQPFQHVVVSVDVDLKRIGLARQELAKVPNATPAKIDKRGYVQKLGRSIADKLALEIDGAPLAFEYVGPVDEGGVRWYAFELVESAE